MARDTLVQRIALEGGEEILAKLKALGAAGEDAFKKIKNAADKTGSPGAKLAQSIDQLRRQFGPLASAASSVARSFNDFERSLLRVGRNSTIAATAITGAVVAFTAFVKAGADAATVAGEQAQALGVPIDAYGRLTFAAEQAGLSAEEFGGALTRLNKTIGSAADGNEKALALFKRLGVSIKDATGEIRPTEEVLLDLADAFAALPEGAEKSALAMQFFGRSGAQLLPFLNEGQTALRALGKEAERLGIVFTEQQFKIGDALGDALDKLNTARKGITAQLSLVFAKDLTRAAEAFVDILVRNREALLEWAESIRAVVVPVVEDLFNAFAGNDELVNDVAILRLRDSVVEFGIAVRETITGVVIPAFQALLAIFDAVAKGINLVFGTQLTGTMLAAGVAVLKFLGVLTLLRTSLALTLATGRLVLTLFGVQWLAVFASAGAAIRNVVTLLATLAANPLVRLVGGLVGLAAILSTLSERQLEAKINAEGHSGAMAALDEAIRNMQAGVPGATAAVEALSAAQRKNIETSLAQAQALLQTLRSTALADAISHFGDVDDPEIREAWANQDIRVQNQLRLIEALQGQLVELDEKLSAVGKGAGAEPPPVLEETRRGLEDIGKAADAADQKLIHVFAGDEIRKFGVDANGAARALDGAAEAVDDVGEAVDEAGPKITRTFAGGRGAIRGFADAAGDAADDIGEDFDDAGASAGRRFAGGLIRALPEGEIRRFAGGLIRELDHVKEAAGSVGPKIINVQEALAKLGTGAAKVEDPTEPIQTGLTETIAAAEQAGPAIGQSLSTGAQTAQAAFVQLSGEVDRLFATLNAGGAAAPAAAAEAPAAGGAVAGPFAGLVSSAEQAKTAILAIFATLKDEITRLISGGGVAPVEGAEGEGGGAASAGEFQSLIVSAQAAKDQVVLIFTDIGSQITAAVSASVSGVSAFESIVSGAQDAARAVVSAFQGLGSTLRSTFSAIVSGIKSQFDSLAAAVRSLISRLEAELRRLAAAIAAAKAQAGGKGGGGLARGGSVFGPGTGTSDSIPAWLSRGEFVVRASAARQYLPLLHAINNFRLPKDFLRGFSWGGLVDNIDHAFAGLMPRGYAMGGLVPAQARSGGRTVNVNLDLGDERVSFIAPEEVGEAFVRLGMRRQNRSLWGRRS